MTEIKKELNTKISTNNTAIGFIEQEIPKSQALIDSYSPYLQKLDDQIISITASINDLKNQIVVLSEDARSVGCGTTVGMSTVYPDIVRYHTENATSESYDGKDPFGGQSSSPLNLSSVGVGTILILTQNDSSGAGIGTLYGGIGSCFSPGIGSCLTDADCTGYATSIASLNTQITTLRNQLPTIISNSNSLREERRYSQIERYGQKRGVAELKSRNSSMQSTISVLENI